MGKATTEKKERNDKLVLRYMELSKEYPNGGFLKILETEFDLGHSAIYAILKRRGIRTRSENVGK